MLELTTNDVRLLLDENISPNIAPRLWEQGVDAVPLRDRAMLRASDSNVLKYAQDENRAVATIDEGDFEKLVASMKTHAGVISIPSGGSRDEQFAYIMAAVNQLRSSPNPMSAARDSVIAVNEELKVVKRSVVLPAPAAAPSGTGLTIVAKPSAS